MAVRKLKEFLDREKVKYVSIIHSTAYTAQEVAASAHITGKELAKTVIVELDGKMAMAVLPANRKIVLQDLREVTGSDEVKFASEDETHNETKPRRARHAKQSIAPTVDIITPHVSRPPPRLPTM